MTDNEYFVSREGSMGERLRTGTPRIGREVKKSAPYWTVYQWVDRKAKVSKVIYQGFTLEGAENKATELNYKLAVENGMISENPKRKYHVTKYAKTRDKEYIRTYNREYARKRRAKKAEGIGTP